MKKLLIALLVASVVVECGVAQSGASERPLSAADVIGLLEKQELGLRTLQVEVLCHVERGPVLSPDPSGDMHLEVWRLGSPHGKMRVDYDSEIWPIENGGHREEVRSLSYDGRFGYQLVDSSNRVGENLRREGSGTVFVERPSGLDIASNYCAWTATTFGVFGTRGERFSAVLRYASDRLTVRQDDRTVTLEFSSLQGDEFQVVLDREHHWALRSFRHRRAGITLREIEVESFHDLDVGYSYPASVVDTIRDERGARRQTCRVTCASVQINAPEFPADVFTLDIPPSGLAARK